MLPANKGKSNSIRCFKGYGPSFGFGDLKAESEPFNGKNACRSWSWKNYPTYNIGVDSQGINKLTNQPSVDAIGGKVCRFTISELEVWKVKMVGGEKKQK